MKRKEQELLQKSIIRSVLLLIAVFSFITGVLIIIENCAEGKEKKESITNYESNGSITYQIDLKENDFYNADNLNYQNIISKYIDNININFKYDLSSSQVLNLNSTYSLNMYLISTYNSNNKVKEIWKEKYELIPKTTHKSTGKTIMSFDKKIDINYEEYNKIAEKIRQETGILTNAYLKLEFNINNDLVEENKNIKFSDEHLLEVDIPLLENITSIEKKGEFNKKETLYNIVNMGINYKQLALGICLTLVSLAFVITAIKMFLEVNGLSKYVMEQNKILKRYGDVIAETANKPELNGLNIMEITNFTDLINIEDELRIPILFYETFKGKESWFVIIDHDKAYRYILKAHTKTKKNTKKKESIKIKE